MPRLDRGIQYAVASPYVTAVSRILDRPPAWAMTAESLDDEYHKLVIASQRRGKRGPMTGSAKQSRIFPRKQSGLLRRISAKLLRNFVASSSQ
ncbi:hypothetical protein EAS61_05115 [Bradyrhizobium zhanjiangense]|uniref:Uncharacterized protein n=1 Tax=Bradyrhizobium zhanjiangense TaxID=1325107 RepID=A0A4Q0QVZ8_9BRAD|nr:hypothetical protein EAS61_05115 [Bradyrhizobium zhanjiangense]